MPAKPDDSLPLPSQQDPEAKRRTWEGQKFGRGQHPNSKAALRPYRPGQSGNPGGRRKPVVAPMLYQLAMRTHPGDPQGRTNLEIYLTALLKKALAGDVAAAKELNSRLDGRTPLGEPIEDETSVKPPVIVGRNKSEDQK